MFIASFDLSLRNLCAVATLREGELGKIEIAIS